MPLYEIEAGGKRFQIDAPDDAALHETIKGLTSGGAPSAPPAGNPFAPDGQNMGFGTRAQREPAPTQDLLESTLRGVKQGFTGNFGDEVQGLAAASPIPGQNTKQTIPTFNAIDAIAGGVNLLGQKAGLWGGNAAQRADEVTAQQRQADAQAATDHPVANMAGNVAGAVLNPLTRPTGTGIGGAVKTGAVYGGIYGAGDGTDATSRALGAAGGAAVGGVLGGGAYGAVQGLGALAGKAGDLIGGVTAPARAAMNADASALRRIGRGLEADAATGQGMTAAELAAAKAEGAPLIAADLGGSNTKALMRSAANTSPDARAAIEGAVMERSASQAPRIADRVADITGSSGDVEGVRAALQAEAKAANRPAYQRAYAEGSNGVWHEGLAQLATAPAVQKAIKEAETTGANRAAADGFIPVKNPFAPAENGQMQLRGDATPNLQFWDHVKRNLDDQIGKLKSGGERSAAADITALKNQLVSYLDQLVPSYKKARAGAAQAFGAEDALDAGQKFISANIGHMEARRAVAKMSAPERALFADGFATALRDKINSVSDRSDVVNRVFGTPKARERVEIALGKGKATQLEMSLRIETIMSHTKNALGNSTTARQIAEIGLAGGAGGLAGYASTDDLKGMSMGTLFGGLARKGVLKIDQRVAQRVGEMLASSDLSIREKALAQVARNPALQNLVRKVEEMVVKGTTQASGAVNEITVRPLLGGMRPALSGEPQQEEQRQRQ